MSYNIDQERIKRIARAARKQVDAGYFSTVEWRVCHHNEVVSDGIVAAPADNAGAVLPKEPIYRIYSMTKPIVSIAALRMIENGDFYLPTPVANIIPEFSDLNVCIDGTAGNVKTARNPLTIEHLLTHRSGLSYDFLVDCPVAALYREHDLINAAHLSLEDFTKQLAGFPLASEPGTAWRYSYSTDVLARVLEVVGGKPLQQVLDDLIFTPCEMQTTRFCLKDTEVERLLPMFGQRGLDEEMFNIAGPQTLTPMNVDKGYPLQSPDFARGGHGLYSTADDYLKFMQVLTDGYTKSGEMLVSKPMLEMMWKDRIPPTQQPLVIGENILGGYGWNLFGRVLKDSGQTAFLSSDGEGGWAGAAATYFWVDRATGLSGLSMTQYLGSSVALGDIVRSAAYQSLA